MCVCVCACWCVESVFHHVPEILWAELRLQELEELLSSHRIFENLIDAKGPPLYPLLAWLLTAGGHTKVQQIFHRWNMCATYHSTIWTVKNISTDLCIDFALSSVHTWLRAPRVWCHLRSRDWMDLEAWGRGRIQRTALCSPANCFLRRNNKDHINDIKLCHLCNLTYIII